MKDETAGVAIKEFVGLKPKTYSFLVDDSNEHKKAKGVGKNIVAAKSHNKHKNVLLNNKCLKHLMNRTQTRVKQDPIKSTKFLHNTLLIKYIS